MNGSPTKTQMVDGAGGRSQLAQLTTGVIVGIVLLVATGPIQYLPTAVLASVVFVIGLQLVDVRSMRQIFKVRRDEFAVATLTAATVVLIGVEQGIVLAIVASVIIHLRRSYRPTTAVMVARPGGDEWHGVPAGPEARTEPGLVVFRFGSGIYYANAEHLVESVLAMLNDPAAERDPIRWFCLDGAAVADIDYTGAQVLRQLHSVLAERHIKLSFAVMMHGVQSQLVRYGLVDLVGADAVFDSVSDAVRAFHLAEAAPGAPPDASA